MAAPPNQARFIRTGFLPYDTFPGGGGAAVPPFSRLYYVDASTTTPAPLQDGGVGTPFATIQAAINAGHLALPIGVGFCVYVTPGDYAENLVLPDHDGMSIVGEDEASTILVEAVAGHTVSWVAGLATGPSVHRFLMVGITIRNSSAGFDAIHFDGTAASSPATFMDTSAELRGTVEKSGAGAGIFLRCAGRFFYRVTRVLANVAPSFALDVSNVTTMIAETCVLNGPCSLGYSGGLHPGSGRNEYAYTDGTTDFYDVPVVPLGFRTTLKGAPIFRVDETCFLLGDAAPGGLAIDGALLLAGFVAPDHMPIILLRGTFGRALSPGTGNILLALPPDIPALVPSIVDLSRGTFNGEVGITRVTAPAAIPALCVGRGAVFTKGTPGSIAVTTAAALALNLDVRDCSLVQTALAAAGVNATIDRTTHLLQAVVLPLAANVIAVVPPFPATMNGYQVTVTPLALPAAQPFVTAKGAGAFTVNGAIPVGGADLELRRLN